MVIALSVCSANTREALTATRSVCPDVVIERTTGPTIPNPSTSYRCRPGATIPCSRWYGEHVRSRCSTVPAIMPTRHGEGGQTNGTGGHKPRD